MAYEPTGKVKPFVDAVRREPARIWKSAEIAIMLGAPQSSVGSWLDYPLKAKAVFRGKQHGQVVYAGQPFPPEAAFPHPSERNAAPAAPSVPAAPAPAADLRIPKFSDTWRAPTMTAPRPGSDIPGPSRAPGPPPASQVLCTGCTRDICLEKGCWSERARVNLAERAPEPAPTAAPRPTPAPTAPPEPAPDADEASIPEEGAGDEESEELEEVAEPDAFISCRTGEIVLVGLEMDDEGRVTIPADLVQKIRRQTAWGPAP